MFSLIKSFPASTKNMNNRLIVFLLSFVTTASFAQTVTPNLGLTLPAQGQTNWGVINNADLTLIDSFAGTTPIFPVTTGIVVATGGRNSRVATYADIVLLFGGGTCSGFLKNDGTCSSGTGGLTSFTTGNLSPIFTAALGANPTTAPALAFTLSNAAPNSVFGNFTGSSAAPVYSNAPIFSAAGLTNFPTLNQSTTGNAATATALAATPTLCTGGQLATGILANGNATGCTTPTGGITSIGLTVPSYLTVTGSPLTANGTLAISGTTGLSANQVLATPNGASGALAVRRLVAADLPIATTSALGVVEADGTTIGVSGGGIISVIGGATLPSGTINQMLYYAASGTTVTPLTLGTNLSITGGILNASSTGATNFNALTSGTNTAAAMVVGTGASIAVSGSGTNQATSAPWSGLTGSVPTFNQNTTGTAANLSGTPALPNGTTATTQTVGDNTTKIATDAFVLANAGAISGGTLGFIPKYGTGGTSLVNSVCNDGISTAGVFTCSEAASFTQISTTGTGGVGGGQSMTLGTAPSGGLIGTTLLAIWADSASTHLAANIANNGTVYFPNLTTPGTAGDVWTVASNGYDLVDGGPLPSGSISGQTAGYFTLASTATTIGTPPALVLDYGVTTASVITAGVPLAVGDSGGTLNHSFIINPANGVAPSVTTGAWSFAMTTAAITGQTWTAPSAPGTGVVHAVNTSGIEAISYALVSLTADVSGLLPVANGGTGTSSPGLVAGTNVTITGSWPNQTIASSSTASTAFSALTGSTNTTAAMVIGTGASLTVSGTGTNNATSVNSNTFPASAGLTSGGFIYASSTSAYASSALITVNVLPKSGGAGTAPLASSITDNGTVVVSTEAIESASGSATSAGLGLNGTAIGLSGVSGNMAVIVASGTRGTWGTGGLGLGALSLGFGSATTANDTGLSRVSAGVVGVGTGAAGSIAGTLDAVAIVLGTDGTTAGTLQTANGAAAFHTIWGSAATANNTILGFTTAPTTGHIVTCTTSGTTCTLTDGGAAATGTVTSIATTGPIGGGTITSTGTITCATCVTSAASLTANAVVIGGGSQASSTISTDTTTTHALFATAGAPAFRALALTDLPTQTGTGSIVLATSPTLVTPALGAATATSLLASGNVDGTAPTTVTTGTTATLGGTFKSGYTINQEATAATAVAYTLPTAAAGLQYCIENGWNGTASTTGVLTLNTSASGQFIIFTDGTLSATGGNVTSGGAAADMACVHGIDSTHWQLSVVRGTWAKH